MKAISQIKLEEVKSILDNATWNYQYCSSRPGQNIDTSLNYLDSQKFSITKIKHFLFHAEECETAKEIAFAIADPLAWDRISKFLYTRHKGIGKGWSVDESVTFNIL